LGLDQGREDFLAAFLREHLLRAVLLHGDDLSVCVLGASERPVEQSTPEQKVRPCREETLGFQNGSVCSFSAMYQAKAQAEALSMNRREETKLASYLSSPNFSF
jgi:hypothetical protein